VRPARRRSGKPAYQSSSRGCRACKHLCLARRPGDGSPTEDYQRHGCRANDTPALTRTGAGTQVLRYSCPRLVPEERPGHCEMFVTKAAEQVEKVAVAGELRAARRT